MYCKRYPFDDKYIKEDLIQKYAENSKWNKNFRRRLLTTTAKLFHSLDRRDKFAVKKDPTNRANSHIISGGLHRISKSG